MGNYNGNDSIFWYKVTFHYKPGSLADSFATHADKPWMAHDTAFWLFSLAGTWSLGETVGAPCNLGWGVNRAMLMGTKDTTYAFRWQKCDLLADPSISTGVRQISSSQLVVSPNPASDMVKLESTVGIQSVRVMDITGRTVKTIMAKGSSEISISIADMPSSIYLLRIAYTNGTSVTSKLLKK
jgi:hypothetical protein